MASGLITLGIGTPGTVSDFILVGLSPGEAVTAEPHVTSVTGRYAPIVSITGRYEPFIGGHRGWPTGWPLEWLADQTGGVTGRYAPTISITGRVSS